MEVERIILFGSRARGEARSRRKAVARTRKVTIEVEVPEGLEWLGEVVREFAARLTAYAILQARAGCESGSGMHTLVVDTNIIFSAVVRPGRIRETLFRAPLKLYAPQELVEDRRDAC